MYDKIYFNVADYITLLWLTSLYVIEPTFQAIDKYANQTGAELHLSSAQLRQATQQQEESRLLAGLVY